MWEKKKGERSGSLDQKAVPDHCSRFRVSATSEQKTLSHNILVTAEAISAAAACCTLQLISIRAPFPKD